jgi:hypothetical protein
MCQAAPLDRVARKSKKVQLKDLLKSKVKKAVLRQVTLTEGKRTAEGGSREETAEKVGLLERECANLRTELAARDSRIAMLEAAISELRNRLESAVEKVPTPPKVVKDTKMSWAAVAVAPPRYSLATEAAKAKKPTTTVPATQGAEWKTAGPKGKALQPAAAPRPPAPKRTVTPDQAKAFFSGQPLRTKPKGLKRLYVPGLERQSYGQIRQLLSAVGVQVSHVRNLLFHGSTLELLVFAEDEELIKGVLQKEANAKVDTFNVLLSNPSANDLRRMADRYGKCAERLPAAMHYTKKTILSFKTEALAQAKAMRSPTNEVVTVDSPVGSAATMDVVEEAVSGNHSDA